MGGGAKNQQSALKNEELKRGPCGETEALYRHENEADSRVRIKTKTNQLHLNFDIQTYIRTLYLRQKFIHIWWFTKA